MSTNEAHPANHPFVEYLNSLRTQEHGANPSFVHENRKIFLEQLRATAAWFPSDDDLHVPTRLDGLASALTEGSVPCDLIFLTGDAGDGKTALCAAVAERLGCTDELQDVTEAGGWIIVKDASEVEPERLEALLAERLFGRGPKLLVAINEGRLRRIMRPQAEGSPGGMAAARPALWADVIEPALRAWTDEASARRLDERMRAERVMALNFRHRFHVPAVVPGLLNAWTRPRYWEDSPACRSCGAASRCPIAANAKSLGSPAVQENISEVLQSAHFSGQRLPFRRLQAVLALTVTAGLKCRDVQTGELANANALDLLRYRYYEALFRTDAGGPVPVTPEAINRFLAPADPGLASTPAFDREVGYAATPDKDGRTPVRLGETALPSLEEQAVRFIRESSRSAADPDMTGSMARLTQALRRWAGISDVSSAEPPEPWRKALRYLREYATGGDGRDLRLAVTAAINRYHFLAALNEQWIARRQIAPAGFRDPARLALELDLGVEFATSLSSGPVLPEFVRPWLESAASEIYFEARPATGALGREPARLHLNARLLETLLNTGSGFTYVGALGAYRMDLARFHSRLLALAHEAESDPKVLLRVGGKTYRASCEPGANGAPARLRFDGED